MAEFTPDDRAIDFVGNEWALGELGMNSSGIRSQNYQLMAVIVHFVSLSLAPNP